MFLPLLLFIFSSPVCGLQCYTGFKYLSGQSIGTDTETCAHSTDYCYNATAGLSQFAEVKMAGCSTTRCFLSHNKCIQQTFQGHDLMFCCCNTGDLCNSKYTDTRSTSTVDVEVDNIDKGEWSLWPAVLFFQISAF